MPTAADRERSRAPGFFGSGIFSWLAVYLAELAG
jgi:hypothetical protein